MKESMLSYQQKDPIKLLCKVDLKRLFPSSVQKERDYFDKKWNPFKKFMGRS